ncbi:hypothetical protein FACS1894199_17750 [Bacteroidia bacterium]|nr:hypothetical protein FACS1894199_17750 [Bacteroidia bacterium]
MANLDTKTIKVKELLQKGNLHIPHYQRPYKWTEKNVNQLIDDILLHKAKSAYRIGTLVVHLHWQNSNKEEITEKEFDEKGGNKILDIVDGQQRTITLALIIHALTNSEHKGIKELADFKTNLINLPFSNDISKANIQNNYKAIERRTNEFDEDTILFFFNKCELVEVILADISEAFQFFDSQNARGKDLEPHDLLKAYHLREMNNSSTEEERRQTVENWEEMDTNTLSKLFALYLYRIRNWSKGRSARYFTKNEVDIFKGVSPEIQEDYPFAKIYRIAHYYTENYNQAYNSKMDKNNTGYPFQIDQTIINGKRFFEMVAYYNKLIGNMKANMKANTEIQTLNTIKNYAGNYRTGDKYVRNLFYCGLIYYIDKFGENELPKAIDKIFIWAYTLRLKLYSIGLDSVDNYALNKAHSQVQLFQKIREAVCPSDILNIKLEILKENRSSKTEEIVKLFEKMKYYER